MLSPEACMLKLIHLYKFPIIQFFSIIDGLRTVIPTIQSIQCFLNEMSVFIIVLIMEVKINCNMELQNKERQDKFVVFLGKLDQIIALFYFYFDIKLCFVLT